MVPTTTRPMMTGVSSLNGRGKLSGYELDSHREMVSREYL